MAGEAAARLSEFIKLTTIAPRIDEPDIRQAYSQALDFLSAKYPAIARTATIEIDEPWSFVARISGSDATLKPVLMIAHYDVVDIAPGTLEDWDHEPFSGLIDEEFIWGRGSLDDKSTLLAMMEAVEYCLQNGGLTRGVILAFGGDEEMMGVRGAGRVAERLHNEGIEFHCALDEGSIISVDMLSNPRGPIAIVGVAEKGYADVVVRAAVEGGHSSMPPANTALGLVAAALAHAESHPFATRLIPTIRGFFKAIGCRASGVMRVVYTRIGLLWPVVRLILSRGRTTAALIRTTQAVTMASGSSAPNVLPATAEANINVRILPGESTDDVLRHYQRLFRRHNVTVSLADEASGPVAASSINHSAYVSVKEATQEVDPECIVAPFLVVGSTDSKWYASMCETVIRFVPVRMTSADLSRVHGTNERISIAAYDRVIEFYKLFLQKECRNG